MTSINKTNFSVLDTQQAKGVAVLFLFFHHLFMVENTGLYKSLVLSNEAVYKIAVFSKVCVGIFIFLSGYGLFQSQKGKEVGLKSFYVKNFTKLYSNYWLIWLIFVPLGVFVFGRSFADAYGSNSLGNVLKDISGFQYMWMKYGYNPTWWFMTCILTLYLIYPALKVVLQKFDWLFVSAVFVWSLFSINISFVGGIQPYEPIREYLFTFVLGMYFSKNDLFVKFYQLKFPNALKYIACALGFIVFAALRFQLGKKSLIITDGVLSIALLQFLFMIAKKSSVLVFIGKHSFNLFLSHTFILLFAGNYVYALKYPLLIFIVFTFVCVFVSFLLEKLKYLIRFERISFFLTTKKFQEDILI